MGQILDQDPNSLYLDPQHWLNYYTSPPRLICFDGARASQSGSGTATLNTSYLFLKSTVQVCTHISPTEETRPRSASGKEPGTGSDKIIFRLGWLVSVCPWPTSVWPLSSVWPSRTRPAMLSGQSCLTSAAGVYLILLFNSVSDPYSLNPDPAKNLDPDPDPRRPLNPDPDPS